MISFLDFYVIATRERPTRFVKTKDELVDFFIDARRFSDEEYAKDWLDRVNYNSEDFIILPAYASIQL